jgi:hypothetical protein
MRQMQLDAKTGILTAGAGCRLEEVNRFLLAAVTCQLARAEQSVWQVLHLAAAMGCLPENGV